MFKWGSPKSRGDLAEDRALRYLQQQGLQLIERNYRVAAGPHARGGEVDLILRERDGTRVFVEVRARASTPQGGTAASVTPAQQRRLVYAARHYLLQQASPPPCHFDVLALDGEQISWLRAAFDAD